MFIKRNMNLLHSNPHNLFYFVFNTDQIGLTPEEVISKIMANPDVAMAFQNPRVQAAIMDVSNFYLFPASPPPKIWPSSQLRCFVCNLSDFGTGNFSVFAESSEYRQVSKRQRGNIKYSLRSSRVSSEKPNHSNQSVELMLESFYGRLWMYSIKYQNSSLE